MEKLQNRQPGIVASFADRLKEAMTARHMQAVDLVAKTGISQATISQYRSGYAEPKRDKIALLAEALHVSQAWLYGLDAPMEPSSYLALRQQDQLKVDEAELVLAYRKADDKTRKIVRQLLDLEVES